MGKFKMRNLRTLLLLSIGIFGAQQTFATLPQDSRRAGGIAVIPLSNEIKTMTYQGQNVLITEEDQQRYAIFGIPLATAIGTLKLDTNTKPILIEIKPHKYAEQRLTVKNQDHVNPNTEQLARYQREAEEQNQIYRSFTPAQSVGFPEFIVPTKGKFSNSFGRKRFFNGEERAPHSGLDIPAPVGQKIVAPASGTVQQIGDYFFNGKTVLIDHGQGLISMFCHLSRIDVVNGQQIKQGETLGLVGNTGRVTGAHLHWGMSLNDARVDPQLFLH